jgi:hypothetical protein
MVGKFRKDEKFHYPMHSININLKEDEAKDVYGSDRNTSFITFIVIF